MIYDAGYRKVPENAVVLSREEFDRMNFCIKSEEEVRAIIQQEMLPIQELTTEFATNATGAEKFYRV